MNIIFIAPSAYLLGGVQDWLYSTVIGLRERGHKVRVGVPDGFFHKSRIYNHEFRGLNAEIFKNYSGTNEGRVTALERFLIKKKPELVVGVNIGNLFEAIARLKKRYNLRFAMTIHGLEANYFEDARMHKSIIDGLITTNRLSMRLAEDIGQLKKDRIYYAPYGVPIEKTQPRRDDKTKVVWVGRLEQAQKRIMDVIDIARNLDEMRIDYKLSIAGEGPHKYQLEKALERQVANGMVNFCGRLNKEELKALYRDNNILLITSQWETGPIVAWEAISAGCSLVSSKYIGCMAEKTLLDKETALLFNIGNTSDAAYMIAALRERGLRERIQMNSKELVSQRYSMKASLDAWEAAFEQILQSNEPSTRAGRALEECIERPVNGRIERYLGLSSSEFIRSVLPKKKPKDAGSEWPHSLQGISDQSKILEYAKKIEDSYQNI